jgi:hypothetical protein
MIHNNGQASKIQHIDISFTKPPNVFNIILVFDLKKIHSK